MNTPTSTSAGTPFSPFWPLIMLGVSVVLFMGWQVVMGARQHVDLLRLADQQNILATQAGQREAQLQSLMMELLDLAKTDDDAREIADKYNIKFNPPSAEPTALQEALKPPTADIPPPAPANPAAPAAD